MLDDSEMQAMARACEAVLGPKVKDYGLIIVWVERNAEDPVTGMISNIGDGDLKRVTLLSQALRPDMDSAKMCTPSKSAN